MKKQVLLLALFLVLFTGAKSKIFAGDDVRMYPDMDVSIAPGSDYQLVITYSGANPVDCDCAFAGNRNYKFYLFKDYNDDASVETWDPGETNDGIIYYVIGPNSSGAWALKYREWCSASLCNEWTWSGYPRAMTSDGTNAEGYSRYTQASTVPIISPESITASSDVYYDKIVLNWIKGSDIPDTVMIEDSQFILYYKIYRNDSNDPSSASLITTLPVDARSWSDNDIDHGDEYYYWVTTCTDGWNGHESVRTTGNAVLGKAKTFAVVASDGEYTNRVKIEWNDLSSFTDEIRIERSVPNNTTKEELDILSKNSTVYNDVDAIPGYNYTYFVTPIKSGRTFSPMSDSGYVIPNGKISGYVKSLLNSGVNGVEVCAKPVTSITAGAVAMPENGYCATTDMNGYYEIREIYFFEGAEFSIVPHKGGTGFTHVFSPDSLNRRLDLNAKISTGADFTDQSEFTVKGRVIYPVYNNDTCGIPNVEIKINNQSRGVFTKPDGSWDCTFQDEGSYTFKPVFLHHHFVNNQGAESTTVFVDRSYLNMDFRDIETDEIKVRVQSGCGDPVATNFEYATITVSAGNCFSQTLNTDANGLVTFSDLPARKYDVQVTMLFPELSNVMSQIGSKPISVDLTVRDTTEITVTRQDTTITPGYSTTLPNGQVIITPADTTYTTVSNTTRTVVIPAADFIYHSPLQISVNFEDAGAIVPGCTTSDGDPIVLMEQNISYPLVFEVMETLGNCPVQEGTLQIFDAVSDRGDKLVEVPIVNGIANYMITAGLPNTTKSETHPNEKYLYVIAKVGFRDPQPKEFWITVTGVLIQTSSFTTKSPELPLLVLHDPPGDKSSAFVEKGAEFRSFSTTEMRYGGELGAYLNTIIGSKIKTLFFEGGQGLDLKFSLAAGTDEYFRDGYETTVTFNEKFSTSDMENLTGNVGDVYIGASFNQEFALGDELTFDFDSCKADIRTIPTIDITGFATTFMYTEKHLKYTLLPKLGELRSYILAGKDTSQLTEEEKMQANQLLYDSLHWENVLARNAFNRDSGAVFKDNISFSAGAPYNNEYSSAEKFSESFEYNAYVNTDFAIGAKVEFEGGAWIEVEGGVTAKFRWSTKGESGTDTTYTRKVGYTFDDGDMGDFFSVDLKEDTAYGVPAFVLKLGTSSCPHEEGTQPRDKAMIEMEPAQINNVPIGGKAVFTAKLTNKSESRETREYSVQVVSTSNPDGALVKLAGESINFKPASFWIDYNQEYDIALTVERGPLATNYDRIGIMMFPSCEMDLWDEGGDVTSGDTAWIYVDFQSECSNVALHLPGDGWMVNQNNNDILNVAFTGYDINNENLESVTLQYKKEGQGWLNDITVPDDSLKENFYDYAFDVSGLSDGNYRLRAKANCNANGEYSYSYSSEQVGIIDRSSLAPFGMPSPSDGYLRLGQDISVTFDKNIDCNSLAQENIRLFKADSTEISITWSCFDNKLILAPNDDLFLQPELEGVKLFAIVEGVQDNSGNVQKYPTKWSFLVNVSPVSWNPDEVNMSAEETENVVISANLDNSAVISKSFIISEWPDWMVPSVTSASILPGNSYTIQFNKAENLKPGLYTGQVTALVDNVPELLPITLELYAKEINWEVNQHDFEYNMNITAQFSVDQGDLNLSSSTRDKIAAYINGDLRGVGNISYIPELDKYAAFINVLSNKAGTNGSLIQAEDYVLDNSVQDIIITDEGVSSGASRFKKTNWTDFDVYATKDGDHLAEFRVASIKPGAVQILLDGSLLQTIDIPNTENLTTYTTVPIALSVNKGMHSLRILSTQAEFDLNWINFPEYHVRNQHNDQVIKFRMWDGLNGIEYGAIEELTFFNDGVVGNAQNPFLLHPFGGIQDVVLQKGWNWISVNKVSPDMGLGKVFESITPATSLNDFTLKSQTAFSQFMQSTGWLGGLTSIDPRLGYMIYLSSHADTLSMVGNNPESSLSLTLNPKWNWIGYPRPGIKGVNEYLSGYPFSSGDMLKSQFAFAEYNLSANKWIGDLSFFQPGKGYKLFVSSGGNLDMLKSTSVGNLNLNHEFNMTMTAAIQLGSVPTTDDLYLQTYIKGGLRGVAPLTHVDALGEDMVFAMIFGDYADTGEKVELLLWDEKLQQSITLSGEEIRFGIDAINGTLRNPVLLTVSDQATTVDRTDRSGMFKVYPNPFSDRVSIQYSIPDETHVTLSITNLLGAEIVRIVDAKQSAGNYEYVFEAKNLVTGIYFITMKTDTNVEVQKVVLHEN